MSIEPEFILQILGTSVKTIGKLFQPLLIWRKAALEIEKKTQLGGLGWAKARLKVLLFTNTNILFTLPPSFYHATITFLRIRMVREFKITGVYHEKKCSEKLPHSSFWYDENIAFLTAYIDTHQKSSVQV